MVVVVVLYYTAWAGVCLVTNACPSVCEVRRVRKGLGVMGLLGVLGVLGILGTLRSPKTPRPFRTLRTLQTLRTLRTPTDKRAVTGGQTHSCQLSGVQDNHHYHYQHHHHSQNSLPSCLSGWQAAKFCWE